MRLPARPRLLVWLGLALAAGPLAEGQEFQAFALVGEHPSLGDQPASGRRVHALHAYQDRIFLGYGDCTENTGPIDIVSYHPRKHEFWIEHLAGTECVGAFREMGDQLFAPSIDPTHTYHAADFVVLGPSGIWRNSRSLGALHANDLASHDGQDLWLAGSSRTFLDDGKAANGLLWRSLDRGLSWRPILLNPNDPRGDGRYYFVFPQASQLHTVGGVFDGQEFRLRSRDRPLPLPGQVKKRLPFLGRTILATGAPGGTDGALSNLLAFDGVASQALGQAVDFAVDGARLVALRPDLTFQATADLQSWTAIPSINVPDNASALVMHGGSAYLGTADGRLFVGRPGVSAAPFIPAKVIDFTTDAFGHAVAMSDDLLVVGAPSAVVGDTRKAGLAYVFRRGQDGRWRLLQELRSPSASLSGFFGASVTVRGTRLLVGEPKRGASKAHLFEGNNGLWTWRKTLASDIAGFGQSVALGNDFLAVGGHGEGNAPNPASFVEAWREQDGEWIKDWDRPMNEWAGLLDSLATYDVHLAATESLLVIGLAGDPGDNKGAGLALVHRRSNGAWRSPATLLSGAAADGFGASVSVDGERVLVGAPRASGVKPNAGSAYLYEPDGQGWRLKKRFVSTEPNAGDFFGASVALAGDRVVIGAPGRGWAGPGSGSAEVFVRKGDDWAPLARLPRLNRLARDFGASVATNLDGVLVGCDHPSPPLTANLGRLGWFSFAEDGDLDGLIDAWETAHFGASSRAGPFDDPDADGAENAAEWAAGTNPTDPGSALKISRVSREGSLIQLAWPAVPGRRYHVMEAPATSPGSWRLAKTLAAPAEAVEARASIPMIAGSGYLRVIAAE